MPSRAEQRLKRELLLDRLLALTVDVGLEHLDRRRRSRRRTPRRSCRAARACSGSRAAAVRSCDVDHRLRHVALETLGELRLERLFLARARAGAPATPAGGCACPRASARRRRSRPRDRANSSSTSGSTFALISCTVTSKPAVLPTYSSLEEVSGIVNSMRFSSPGLHADDALVELGRHLALAELVEVLVDLVALVGLAVDVADEGDAARSRRSRARGPRPARARRSARAPSRSARRSRPRSRPSAAR